MYYYDSEIIHEITARCEIIRKIIGKIIRIIGEIIVK
jgi:hypothetical protein